MGRNFKIEAKPSHLKAYLLKFIMNWSSLVYNYEVHISLVPFGFIRYTRLVRKLLVLLGNSFSGHLCQV